MENCRATTQHTPDSSYIRLSKELLIFHGLPITMLDNVQHGIFGPRGRLMLTTFRIALITVLFLSAVLDAADSVAT